MALATNTRVKQLLRLIEGEGISLTAKGQIKGKCMLEEGSLQTQTEVHGIVYSGFPIKSKEIQRGQLEVHRLETGRSGRRNQTQALQRWNRSVRPHEQLWDGEESLCLGHDILYQLSMDQGNWMVKINQKLVRVLGRHRSGEMGPAVRIRQEQKIHKKGNLMDEDWVGNKLWCKERKLGVMEESFIQPFNSHVFRAHVILHTGLGAGEGVVHIQQEREIISKFLSSCSM